MPEATIASAVSRINASLTLQPNLFQLFHPIGGVWASCSNFWPAALTEQRQMMKGRMIRFIGLLSSDCGLQIEKPKEEGTGQNAEGSKAIVTAYRLLLSAFCSSSSAFRIPQST